MNEMRELIKAQIANSWQKVQACDNAGLPSAWWLGHARAWEQALQMLQERVSNES